MQHVNCEEQPSIASRFLGMAVQSTRGAKQNAPGSIVLSKGWAQHRTAGLFALEVTETLKRTSTNALRTIALSEVCDLKE